MNNQQAIDRLVKHLEYGWSEPTVEAIVMGINALKASQWIPCSERFPDTELTYESSFENRYSSKLVLIQTKRGETFAAQSVKSVYNKKSYKDELAWYTYGTGGRRMKVISKVVAWMPLPEPCKNGEEANE